ncbi:F-box/kelch-repeat protein At3g23880-like [Daucus carota subsp. sativus]|uniref:F-box/kelch-repeat protein At3g23880-like n=1 Tax=Daucus carota subsp. sativus TaxID=79200 RepID=UPI0030835B85
MKKIKGSTSNSDRNEEIPVDILLTEVFVRLPAQSVVSCMCVCKRWYNSIRKTSFTDFYLKKYNSYADSYLICGGEDSFGLVSCKSLNVISHYPYPSKKFSDEHVQIVGSANGLLCLFSFDLSYEPIYLMNPSIRKYKVIDSSAIVHRTIGIDTRVMLGFGYHQKSKDYKIVRFLERQWVHSWHPGESDVEIYSLCSDAWQEIQVQCFPWIVRDEASSVMCNDNLHWIAHNCDRNDLVVLSFNIEKYVLEEVKLPDLSFHTDSPLTVTAVVLKECLCSFGYVLPVGSGEEITRCYLWIMKDYGVAESWTMLYEIDCQVKIRRYISSTREDGLILEDIHENILLYNTETRSFDHLNIPQKPFLVKIVPYMENEDSDDLEQFSEDYSNENEASEEDYYEISDGEVSEGSDKELSEGSDKELSAYHDKESSNQVLNRALKEGGTSDQRGEKDKQLSERPTDSYFDRLVDEEDSSDPQ